MKFKQFSVLESNIVDGYINNYSHWDLLLYLEDKLNIKMREDITQFLNHEYRGDKYLYKEMISEFSKYMKKWNKDNKFNRVYPNRIDELVDEYIEICNTDKDSPTMLDNWDVTR